MFWRRKKPTPESLYRQLLKEYYSRKPGEVREETLTTYPPIAAGIEVKPLPEILREHMELIAHIEQATETKDVFELRYWPAIERFTRTAHLLPASENHHHRSAGGLLHHSLETAYYTMLFGRAGLYGKHFEDKKREARERWLFACFMAGLCHDLGKLMDVQVSSATKLLWTPYSHGLLNWAEENQLTKYYVDWLSDRNNDHAYFTGGVFNKVLTDDDRRYIGEIDPKVLKELMLTLNVPVDTELQSGQPGWPYSIRELLKQADSRSVQEDKKKSRTPADIGIESKTPMVRHYYAGMQRLFQEDRWQVNVSGGAAWVLGPERDLYLVWPRCGVELYERLAEDNIEGVMGNPEVIADILGANDLLILAPDKTYYWRIKPENMEQAPLMALRIHSKWVLDLVKLLPPGLGGWVQADDKELLWSCVPPDTDSQPHTLSQRYGASYAEPEPGKVPAGPVMDNMPGPYRGGAAGLPEPVEVPGSKKSSWWPEIKAVGIGSILGLFFTLYTFVLIGKRDYPQHSWSFYLYGAIHDGLVNGTIVQALIISLLILGNIGAYPILKRVYKRAQQKAAEIEGKAQELLDNVTAEAKKIKDDADKALSAARDEAGEIKRTAKGEAADIRVAAKEEARQEKEAAMRQGQAEAAELLESAKRDVQGKKDQVKEYMDHLWKLLESKAIKEGVPLEKLRELLPVIKKADKDAEEILSRAEIQARETSEAIIAEARAQAQAETTETLTQARIQAQEESRRLLQTAQNEAVEIVDRARAQAAAIRQGQVYEIQEARETAPQPQEQVQGDDVQSGQDDLVENYPSPDKNIHDGKQGTDSQINQLHDSDPQHLASPKPQSTPDSPSDNIDDFIFNFCKVEPETSGKASDIYEGYLYWAEQNGVKNPMSQTRFGVCLREKGFERLRTKQGIVWQGISLTQDDEEAGV